MNTSKETSISDLVTSFETLCNIVSKLNDKVNRLNERLDEIESKQGNSLIQIESLQLNSTEINSLQEYLTEAVNKIISPIVHDDIFS